MVAFVAVGFPQCLVFLGSSESRLFNGLQRFQIKNSPRLVSWPSAVRQGALSRSSKEGTTVSVFRQSFVRFFRPATKPMHRARLASRERHAHMTRACAGRLDPRGIGDHHPPDELACRPHLGAEVKGVNRVV